MTITSVIMHLRATAADFSAQLTGKEDPRIASVLLDNLDRSRSVSLVPGGVDIVLSVAKRWKKLRLAHVSSH